MNKNDWMYVLLAVLPITSIVAVAIAVRKPPEEVRPVPRAADTTIEVALVDAVPSGMADAQTVVHMEHLPMHATYTRVSDGACLTISSRIPGVSWWIPYPHHMVLFGERPIDCGFFPTTQQDGWRVAFCTVGGVRKPTKLFLRVSGETLLVGFNEGESGLYRKGECK